MPVTCLNFVLQDGGTPLYWASFFGHKETVMFLLEHRADANAQDKVYTIVEITLLASAVGTRFNHGALHSGLPVSFLVGVHTILIPSPYLRVCGLQ